MIAVPSANRTGFLLEFLFLSFDQDTASYPVSSLLPEPPLNWAIWNLETLSSSCWSLRADSCPVLKIPILGKFLGAGSQKASYFPRGSWIASHLPTWLTLTFQDHLFSCIPWPWRRSAFHPPHANVLFTHESHLCLENFSLFCLFLSPVTEVPLWIVTKSTSQFPEIQSEILERRRQLFCCPSEGPKSPPSP